MIAGEDGADRIANRISEDDDRLISAVARWETTVALHRSRLYEWKEAQASVDRFLADRSVRFVTIGEMESQLALNIFAQFGKGSHRAGLNMGDCFAAACAIANEAWLVHKGDDFQRTRLDWIDRA